MKELLSQYIGEWGWLTVLAIVTFAFKDTVANFFIGRYIGAVPSRALGATYGEFLPGTSIGVNGEILCAAVNYQNNSINNYDVFVGNYGTASPFGRARIGTAVAGTFGSLELSFTVGSGIPIAPTDYIGIYVEDPQIAVPPNPPPQVMIEGTVYFSLF